jgi:hypothetical protein
MNKKITDLLTLTNTSRAGVFSQAGKNTNSMHGATDLEIVTFTPVYKLSNDTLNSCFSNATSLPFVKLLKKPATDKHAARYLDCLVSNGAMLARVDLHDIGAIAGVSQMDREVLAELFETVLHMVSCSNLTHPQETNGFKITTADHYDNQCFLN